MYCLLQKPKYYTNQDLNSGVLSCFAFNHCGMGSVDKKAQMVWLNLFPFRLLKFEHGFVVFGSAIWNFLWEYGIDVRKALRWLVSLTCVMIGWTLNLVKAMPLSLVSVHNQFDWRRYVRKWMKPTETTGSTRIYFMANRKTSKPISALKNYFPKTGRLFWFQN